MTDTTKPKREKPPTTTIGTLGKINKLLTAHTPTEQAKILGFLNATEQK